MRRIGLSLILILTVVCLAAAQNRTFRWSDESCSYVGTYDPNKVSLPVLTDTLKMIRPGRFNIETNTTVWSIVDIARIDVAALDREYKFKSTELAALAIPKTPYWQEFRAKKLRELNLVYRLNRVTMLGYRDRKSLLQFTDAPACTTRYANPLIAGGDDLLNTWRTLNEEERKKNIDPDRLRRTFDQQFKSADRMNYALLEVMSFGWFNCANELIDYIAYDGTPEKEFEKLFVTVQKPRCSEP
ncbi:MAG: hypothetical protein JO314_07935 [Acidobacteria bacterium]|nr:hypothetical protein [Acidobacteriota bacterium]